MNNSTTTKLNTESETFPEPSPEMEMTYFVMPIHLEEAFYVHDRNDTRPSDSVLDGLLEAIDQEPSGDNGLDWDVIRWHFTQNLDVMQSIEHRHPEFFELFPDW